MVILTEKACFLMKIVFKLLVMNLQQKTILKNCEVLKLIWTGKIALQQFERSDKSNQQRSGKMLILRPYFISICLRFRVRSFGSTHCTCKRMKNVLFRIFIHARVQLAERVKDLNINTWWVIRLAGSIPCKRPLYSRFKKVIILHL